jgi:hypothetical protein
MKKIDLNFPILDLDGIELEGSNAGKIVANVLVNQTQGDAVKFWGWALELNKRMPIELDESDFSTLKTFVKNSEALPIITKAQILRVFND